MSVLLKHVRQCTFVFIKCPRVSLSVFEITQPSFLSCTISYLTFYNTLACTRQWHTDTFMWLQKVGAPEEEIAWTQHSTCGFLHTQSNTWACFRLVFVMALLFSDFQYHVSQMHTAHWHRNLTHHRSAGLQNTFHLFNTSLHFFFLISGWSFDPGLKIK